MDFGLVYSQDYLKHFTSFDHPENPARLIRVMEALKGEDWFREVSVIVPKKAEIQDLARVHSDDYLIHLEDSCSKGTGYLNPDTYINKDSFEIARLAAGGVIEGLRRILSGDLNKVFCLVRPPGHHALKNLAMGFCLLNNLAIGAEYAFSKGIKRIMILDWDAHHGNGIQDIFYQSKSVLYISLHQYPHYPGTGNYDEIGEGKGEGFTVNFPLLSGSGDAEYFHAFNNFIIKIASQYEPEIIFVAAGYDNHIDDPLSSLRASDRCFAYMTKKLLDLAENHCQGKILLSLEGGYNYSSLSSSCVKTIGELSGLSCQGKYEIDENISNQAKNIFRVLGKYLKDYWVL